MGVTFGWVAIKWLLLGWVTCLWIAKQLWYKTNQHQGQLSLPSLQG